nr:MAG TPA: hypothetical protein [Herelleviridae sp.]
MVSTSLNLKPTVCLGLVVVPKIIGLGLISTFPRNLNFTPPPRWGHQ